MQVTSISIAPAVPAPDDAAACRHYPDKRAAPAENWLGETVDVRLTVRGGCGSLESSEPPDVILIVDEGGSMKGERMATAQAVARNFVSEMDLTRSRVGLVGFDNVATLYHSLSGDLSGILEAIDRLGAGGGTRIDLGLNVALREMRRGGRPGVARPIFILLSDGNNTAGHEPVLIGVRRPWLARRSVIEDAEVCPVRNGKPVYRAIVKVGNVQLGHRRIDLDVPQGDLSRGALGRGPRYVIATLNADLWIGAAIECGKTLHCTRYTVDSIDRAGVGRAEFDVR